jgi:DNA polymerase
MSVTAASRAELAAGMAACTRCPLYLNATQAVGGDGPTRARVMVVGEQPGDREDIEGRPFVGPAGRILDEALKAAGIARGDVYLTNAVKHFKFEQRGKRRLHKRPNAYEIDRCNWWLEQERALLRPAVIVALGATAWRAVAGKTTTIKSARGKVGALADGTALIVTIHPSFLLRIKERGDYLLEKKKFARDLALARAFVGAARAKRGAA